MIRKSTTQLALALIFSVVFAFGASFAGSARALPITYEFSGELVFAEPPLQGLFSVGDKFIVTLSVDESAPVLASSTPNSVFYDNVVKDYSLSISTSSGLFSVTAPVAKASVHDDQFVANSFQPFNPHLPLFFDAEVYGPRSEVQTVTLDGAPITDVNGAIYLGSLLTFGEVYLESSNVLPTLTNSFDISPDFSVLYDPGVPPYNPSFPGEIVEGRYQLLLGQFLTPEGVVRFSGRLQSFSVVPEPAPTWVMLLGAILVFGSQKRTLAPRFSIGKLFLCATDTQRAHENEDIDV